MRNLDSTGVVAGLAIAVTVGVAVAASGSALAAKMTYEEAFAACKTQVDQKMAKSVDGKNEVQRATAGAACMKKAGFKLKNPADF